MSLDCAAVTDERGWHLSEGAIVSDPRPAFTVASMRVGVSPCVLIGMLSVLLLAGCDQPAPVGRSIPVRDPEVSQRGRTHSKPGPWGKIEYVRMTIEQPETVVPEFPKTNTATRWFFPGLGVADLARLLRDLPVTPAQRSALLDTNCLAEATNGLWLTPPREVILELEPEARGNLYRILAEDPVNDCQRNPFTFQSDSAAEWFQNSGLEQSTVDLVSRLVYRRGRVNCFSDLPDVLPSLPADSERRRLWRSLSRETTLLAKLYVTPDSNIEQLVEYWGRGGKGRALRPFFESLASVEGGVLVDVTHFLPPFARDRLYTYPLTTDPRAGSYDCFWSAMNFFNPVPDMRFLDLKHWEAALKESYTTVKDAPIFGDLVFLLNPEGGAFHAAVYIADDLVFSKNGASYAEPWVLMTISDMMAFYEAEKPVRIVFKRKKSDPGGAPPGGEIKLPFTTAR